jgi:hypothetical protein
MSSAAVLKSIRMVHSFLGLFFAPTILFFATTGGLQMFGLHESSGGSSYVPPAILTHLSQLHKKGTLYLPPAKVSQGPAKPDSVRPNEHKKEGDAVLHLPAASSAPNPLPMKIFFACTALALIASTLTGIFMGWKYARRKYVVLWILLAGILVPMALLCL